MSGDDSTPAPRRFVNLFGSVSTPPLSESVRRQAGALLRRLQNRESLSAPHFKAIPEIGSGAGELRFSDGPNRREWRFFVCCTASEVILIEIHEKRTQRTPKQTIELCRRRLANYLAG